ncbi:MAG: hypothetical protein DMG71_19895 [Acidobacteria bacterium]|nr:MAG: hypothetical protein DMG71_19895 [Acidobacteriota bacterium]
MLTKRTMAEIGGDQRSAEWQSDRPASRGKLKAPWLADALAKLEQKKKSGKIKSQQKSLQSSTEEKKTRKARKFGT